MRTSGPGSRSVATAVGLLEDSGALLLLVLSVPIAIFIVGAPFALLARLVIELIERL